MKRLLLTKDESTKSVIDSSQKTRTIQPQKSEIEEIKDPVKLATLANSSSDIDAYLKNQQKRKSIVSKLFEDSSSKKKQSFEMASLEVEDEKRNQNKEFGGEKNKHTQIGQRDSFNFIKKQFKTNQKYDDFKFKPDKFVIEAKLIATQNEVNIENQKIFFPYQPYEVQIQYMKNVIKTLNSKSNALLESPTGTGKTLCLLTSILSWVENQFTKSKTKIKVIYMSRTHSQLKQVHKELEKTCYRPTMAIFASREQLCIKEELSQLKGKEKIEACSRGVKIQRKLRRQQNRSIEDHDPQLLQAACKYHKERQEVACIARRRLMNVLLDIPTMKKIGIQEEFCPYFYPHNVKNTTTLFLMPYNYILDSYLLTNYTDLLKDSIVIFDEAHNVAQAACEGRSLILDSTNVEYAISQLNAILSKSSSKGLVEVRLAYENEIKFIIRNLEYYKEYFLNFAQQHLPSKDKFYFKETQQKDQGQSKIFNQERTDEYLFQLFCGKVIKDERKGEFQKKQDYYKEQMRLRLLNPLKEIVQYGEIIIEAMKETYDGFCTNFQKFFIFINKVSELLIPKIYKPKGDLWLQTEINHFRLYVQKSGSSFTFGLKCLVPWLTFESIKKCEPRSIILTSGTLKPLQMWQKELQVQFAFKLANNHVISKEQMSSKIICCGPSETSFTFTFDNMNRNKEKIYKDLFQILIQICSQVPNGVLLVFPSFRVQTQFRIELNRSHKQQRLLQCKDIIFEQKNSDNIQTFKKKAQSKKGALLAIVCRGKFSQGIDFPDTMCRAVIIIGIPYPNIKDPFIIEKKHHLDNIAKRVTNKSKVIRGDDWYFIGTIRSINQALGRVIRHARDYGMIFFIDRRYNESKFNKQLPNWVTKNMESIDTIDNHLYKEISKFYTQMSVKYPLKDSDTLQQQKEENEPNPLSFLRKKIERNEQSKKDCFSILMKNSRDYKERLSLVLKKYSNSQQNQMTDRSDGQLNERENKTKFVSEKRRSDDFL